MTNTTNTPITVESKLHPATTVSHIKNYIPVTLEIESSQYNSWATFFKLHCKAFLVFDHLSPKPAASETTTETSSSTTKPTAEWERLDAIVLQWIYSTISNDLLHTIINKTATAHDAWKAIEDLFQDNKSSRAIHLMQKFSNTRLDGFPNISAYCQELKVLADQLANVNAPIDNDRLVLQLIAGLNEQYEGIATILQQQDPLPSFYSARSSVIQVETRKAEQALNASKSASTALTASTNRSPAADQSRNHDRNYGTHDRGYGSGRGRSGHWGRGRSSSGRGRFSSQYPWQPPSYYPWMNTWPTPPSNNQTPFYPWPVPPCPYPSTNRPNQTHTKSPGILGPRPNHQSNVAYTPTDIEQAMYTMSLQQPDPTQYMDTGATGNMTHEQGLQDSDPAPAMQQQR
ncbi:uncharacterized protein LOC110874848 [Helianthus annuus]|uniref:uncharacterized protein LOC110874848 n=1 Tax=Helianthus annuus TaxID=4232 RepID=UPI000B8F2D48|nr:uncharacterized protein LOC110874848 [Helianthus annuus]